MSANNNIEIKSLQAIRELTSEQKQDMEMIKKVESYLKKVAFERASDAEFEDKFGQYGGENVEKWELSEAEQFRELYEEFFPDKDENKVIQSFLRDRYYEYPETISKLGNEKEILKDNLMRYQYIQEHKHDIVSQFEQNYKIFENMQEKYAHFFDKIETYKLLPNDLSDANYLIEAMRGKEPYFYKDQMKYVEDEIGDAINEKTEVKNQLTQRLSELQNKKFLFFHTKANRAEIKDTVNQIQALKGEIETFKEELEQFKKESKDFIFEAKITDDFQYADEINHILYDELLYTISDETLEERKERLENAIDKALEENNPKLIKERINEVDSILSRQGSEAQVSLKENEYEPTLKTNHNLNRSQKLGVKDMIEKAKQKKEGMEKHDEHKKIVEKGVER